MKYFLLALSILGCIAAYSQRNPTESLSIEQRLKRVELFSDTLRRVHINVELVTKKAGAQIETGVGLIGAGIITSIGGSLLLAFYKTNVKTNSRGQVIEAQLSGGQIAGIAFTIGGVGLSIGGLSLVGNGGRKMKHLNADL